MWLEGFDIFLRLVAAGVLGAAIGFERRIHHKAIGIAGMMLIAIGSTTYMLLGIHLSATDPSSLSRTLQGFLSGIGFLGGAVIFKSGFDVKGIKAAAAVWITGALGLAIGTSFWELGVIVGAATAVILFIADSMPDEVREKTGTGCSARSRLPAPLVGQLRPTCAGRTSRSPRGRRPANRAKYFGSSMGAGLRKPSERHTSTSRQSGDS